MACSCPFCYHIQEIGEKDNVYDMHCSDCYRNYCNKCRNLSHYPCFCDDHRRWINRGNEEADEFTKMRMNNCQIWLNYYNKVLNWLDQTESWFNVNAEQQMFALQELRSTVSFLKWLEIHICFNPLLETLLHRPKGSLESNFSTLLNLISLPSSHFKKERLDLIFSIMSFVIDLGIARRKLRRINNPNEIAAEGQLADDQENVNRVRQQWLSKYIRR